MSATRPLQWKEPDEESGHRPRSSQRNTSQAERFSSRRLSTHSRHEIDPATALPIQYRSVSFEIDESQRKTQLEAEKTKGKLAYDLEQIEWHTLSIEEIQKRFEVDAAAGLSDRQVQERLRKYGQNKISPLPNPWFWKIMGYFFKGFGSILLIGGILVFVSWKPLGDPPAVANLALGIVLIAVFFIQAAFNAWQDWSSSRVMASITAMLPESCFLMRDNTKVEVSATDIIPGDLILLKAGNRIPADLRFISASHDASMDRSIVTGESKPVNISVNSTDDNYLQTRCIGLQGTHIIGGHATGIVVATKDSTVFGQIAKLAGEPRTGLTTIEKEIFRFVLLIFAIMITWIVILAAVWGGWLHKDYPDWINVPALIVDCVSVAIAYIPEGLPIAVTSTLTITANLMKKNKILCKSLKTVETLGAVSVICCDKTGTLTQNKMFVTDYAIGNQTFTVPQGNSAQETNGNKRSAVQQLRAISGLCNAAEFDASVSHLPLPERRIFGDATDQAILRFSESLDSVMELRREWKESFELGFDSKRKFMVKGVTCAKTNDVGTGVSSAEALSFDTNSVLLTVKGAPDILLPKCSSYIDADGKVESMTPEIETTMRQIKDRWSNEGKRVILAGRKILAPDTILPDPSSDQLEAQIISEAKSGLTLVGLIGIIDPPRKEISEVMQILRGAGIRMFMVTGDFGLTAVAISRQCGMVTSPSVDDISHLPRAPKDEGEAIKPNGALLLSGIDILSLNEYQWNLACQYPEVVFSRTTPDQKLRIVRELQARDQTVGMTGDGVNDAPALKAADIGISLASGSDIAIEAADMVLLDSFSAIVEAVRYGRVVFDNLKKTIAYLLPAGSFSEFWPVFCNVIFGLPQVLSSFLMIIICCFTDCIAAVVLAYEKPEADVLLRPPRHPKKTRLVNWQLMFHSYAFIGVIESVCSFSMAFWYLERQGIPFSDVWFSFGNLPSSIDVDYYNARLNEASSIYFMNLVVMQWFNLMSVRTRHLSIFQHPPAFNKETQNLLLFPAIVAALGIAVIWLYIPQLQVVLGTSGIPAQHYFLPATFGIGLLCLDEGRKACARRWPNGILAKFAW
ncbi:putative H /K ATPase alpha subunit [Talaromyces proteolyticus]|uniref:H /K ATPase alpha subunit n=1 Tax=Talaromyces proteolyticus TaxID=1131652 RepID=A0AAD4KZE3_9EURO|nr:putative H /K ATPase alpha subunit [Talaromyces proteolyticus]KAH8700901.1 putative H /K ATPase alpha subunit [Talaromyces proteolyticus]